MSTLRAKERVAGLAQRQFNRISRAQLQEIGVSAGTIAGWIANAYLFPELPRVYAVGSRARTTESELAAALLYAGSGAMLSHTTAAWWLGLIDERPRRIHVTTSRRCRSLKGVNVHGRRQRTRIMHRDLPVTSVPEIFLDVAATEPLYAVRRVLSNAEYHELLDLDQIEAVLISGRHGVTRLRQALEQHQPRLAWTKSHLERLLVEICEEEGLPLPEINTKFAGWEVDALWLDHKLAVELDGYRNHHTPAHLRRDRRKEMALRQAGLAVFRYSGEQLTERRAVVAELRQATAG